MYLFQSEQKKGSNNQKDIEIKWVNKFAYYKTFLYHMSFFSWEIISEKQAFWHHDLDCYLTWFFIAIYVFNFFIFVHVFSAPAL